MGVDEKLVDFKFFCGNIFVGVGLVVIEMGLVMLISDEIEVKICVVNIGILVL